LSCLAYLTVAAHTIDYRLVTPPRTLPGPLTLIGFVSFTVVAALVAMYGPSLPELQNVFSVNETEAGFIVSAHFIGTFIGTLTSAFLQTTLTLRFRFILATILIAASSWLLALTPSWAVFLIAAGLRGFGAGVLFTDINGLFATGFGSRSTAMLSLVNAAYGAGSFLGPILVGVLPGSFQTPMLIGAGISLLLVFLAVFTPNYAVLTPKTKTGETKGQSGLLMLALFLLTLFASGGVENTLGTWLATQLLADGYSKQLAANVTGFYWGAQTVGRILLAPLALRFSAKQLLVGGFLLEALALALAHAPSLRILAYVLAGLGVASLFTAGLAWLAQSLSGLRVATTLGLAASLLGAATMSPLTGTLIDSFSANILPTAMLALTIVALIIVAVLWRLTKGIKAEN
jgi:MFS transporter, FHS family, glucose/mannose:H+ symporter